MNKLIRKAIPVIVLALAGPLLCACSGTGDLHEPPLATSPQTAVTVRIHNAVPGEGVTFTIDGKSIYGFEAEKNYEFETDAGSYMFGYRKNFSTCEDPVVLRAGQSYVFRLLPDCSIEIQ